MTLKDWINKEGIATIAKAFRVHESTVSHWRRGWVLPRSEEMRKIVFLSRGAVSYAEIIETFFYNKERGKKLTATKRRRIAVKRSAK